MAENAVYHTSLGASKVFRSVDKNDTKNGVPISLSAVSFGDRIHLAGISDNGDYMWLPYDPDNSNSVEWKINPVPNVKPDRENKTAKLVVLDGELYFAYVPEDKKVLSWWKFNSTANTWAAAPERTAIGTVLPTGQDLTPQRNFSIFEYYNRLWLVGTFANPGLFVDTRNRVRYSTYDLASASQQASEQWTKPVEIFADAKNNFFTDSPALAEPYQGSGVTFVGRYNDKGNSPGDPLKHLVFDESGQTSSDTLFDAERYATSNLAGGIYKGLIHLVYGDQNVGNKNLVYTTYNGVSWSRPTALLDQDGLTENPILVTTVVHAGNFHIFYTR